MVDKTSDDLFNKLLLQNKQSSSSKLFLRQREFQKRCELPDLPVKENVNLPKVANIVNPKSVPSSTNREPLVSAIRLGLTEKTGPKRADIEKSNNALTTSSSREALSVRLSLAEKNASMAKDQMVVHQMKNQPEEVLDAEENYHAFCLEISKLKKKIIQLDQQKYLSFLYFFSKYFLHNLCDLTQYFDSNMEIIVTSRIYKVPRQTTSCAYWIIKCKLELTVSSQ